MDLGTQSQILEITHRLAEPPLVVLGSPDPDSTEITAVTVISGDPTYTGPLAGVQLGLLVYHVLEEEVASAADTVVYEAQIGVMSQALDTDAIRAVMRRIRETTEPRGG
jgi:glycine/sarcosine/betaine reductase complex component A